MIARADRSPGTEADMSHLATLPWILIAAELAAAGAAPDAKPVPKTDEAHKRAGWRSRLGLPDNEPDLPVQRDVRIEDVGLTDLEPDDATGGIRGTMITGKVRHVGRGALPAVNLLVIRYVRKAVGEAPVAYKAEKPTTVAVLPRNRWVEFRIPVPFKRGELADFAVVPLDAGGPAGNWTNLAGEDPPAALEAGRDPKTGREQVILGVEVANGADLPVAEVRVWVELFDDRNRFLGSGAATWSAGKAAKLAPGKARKLAVAVPGVRVPDVNGGRIDVRAVGRTE